MKNSIKKRMRLYFQIEYTVKKGKKGVYLFFNRWLSNGELRSTHQRFD
jgi:hypothetical protein